MRTKKLLAVSVFAIAFGSLVEAAPASADDGCISTSSVGYTVTCSTGGSTSIHTAPVITGGSGGGFPSVNGIPCNQAHFSTCYGMQQNGAPITP
jgi:hypothetical protein